MDKNTWDLSGLKDLDEIYNFPEEAEGRRRRLEVDINEWRFGDIGFRDLEKQNQISLCLEVYIGLWSVEKMGLEAVNKRMWIRSWID